MNRRSVRCRRRIGSSSLVCVSALVGGDAYGQISEIMPEEGAPIARPSVWVIVLPLCWK